AEAEAAYAALAPIAPGATNAGPGAGAVVPPQPITIASAAMPAPVAVPVPPRPPATPDLGLTSPLAGLASPLAGQAATPGLPYPPSLSGHPAGTAAGYPAPPPGSPPVPQPVPPAGPAAQARSTADGLRKLTKRVPGASLGQEDDSLRRATPTSTTRNPLGLAGALSQYLSATTENRPEKEHNPR
ncbi:MAG: hypothetical protein ACRDZX_18640, partial [Acidimicrobiales bacterium]